MPNGEEGPGQDSSRRIKDEKRLEGLKVENHTLKRALQESRAVLTAIRLEKVTQITASILPGFIASSRTPIEYNTSIDAAISIARKTLERIEKKP